MITDKKSIVFIVDDSVTLRKMLNRVLSEMGFVTYEAATGEEALNLFDEVTPDAVLLDVEMPGLSGFVICDQIRHLPQGENVPIMIVTSLEDLESINKAYEVGATDFATKPLNWDVIGHRVLYMIRTGRNYIELQHIKVRLNQLNLELEERVIERTLQLKSANKELRRLLSELKVTQDNLVEAEKFASLGSLVAGVAHEINTPIGVVITGISALGEKTTAMMASLNANNIKRSELLKYLDSAQEIITISSNNLHVASRLVQNFKEISVDRVSENRRVFDLREYLETVILNLRAIIKKRQITTELIGSKKVMINSYPGVISQVLTILAMNSLEHAYEPEQPGALTIEIKELNNNQVELSYSDTGKGIPIKDLKRVFEPFFTTRRVAGNVGLGLNIAYNNVIKVLKGTIKCLDRKGGGVTFVMTFPSEMEDKGAEHSG